MANYTMWGREGDFGASPPVPTWQPAYTGPTGAAAEANYTRYQMGGVNAPIAVPSYTPGGAYGGAIAEQLPAASPNVEQVTVTAAAPGGQAMSWGTGGTSPWSTAAYSPAASPAPTPNVEQVVSTAAPSPQQVAAPAISPNITALQLAGTTPNLSPNAMAGASPTSTPAAGQPAGGAKQSSGGGGSTGGGSGGQQQQPQPQPQQQRPTTSPIYIRNVVGGGVAPAGQVGQSPGGDQAGYAPATYAAGGSPAAGGIFGNLFGGGNMNLVLGLLFGAALLYAASEDQ